MSDGHNILSLIAEQQDLEQFRRKNWIGGFEDYLDIVRDHPQVTRNAFQRVHDMIVSYGTESRGTGRETRTHYRFFDDPDNN